MDKEEKSMGLVYDKGGEIRFKVQKAYLDPKGNDLFY